VATTKVFLYARTSTEEQTNGMESQTEMLKAEAEKRGWGDVSIIREHASGKSLARRHLLQDALRQLDASGGILATTKIDRLSRSMLDYASLLERSRKKGWAIISLDLQLDTSTAVGQCIAHVLCSFAQMERQLISERTKAGLAVVKSRGVQLGHKSTVPSETKNRIAQLREAKVSWRNITNILNAEKVPAPSGKVWHTTSVVRVAKG
jgi:DNA invertase Pin-like site-specific DNA recombinase